MTTEDSVMSEKLLGIIKFLSKEEGMSIDAFIAKTEERIADEKKITELKELIGSLSPSEREKVLHEFTKLSQAPTIREREKVTISKNHINGRFKLEELGKWSVNDLVNRKPYGMLIDGREIPVKSWTAAVMAFVKHLIINNDLKKENLPLSLSSRSKKSFVNATGEPDAGDGSFKKIGEGFYVDVKYNGYSHVRNMQRALERLNVTRKYNIEIEL